MVALRASLVLLDAATALHAASFSGRVVGIADGDTIRVLYEERAERVRLWGIDCPERGQPFGTRARQFTSSLAFGKDVKVIVHDVDRYGRTVGEVILPDGRSLNQELIRAGLAWWHIRFAPQIAFSPDSRLKRGKRGLWADKNPMRGGGSQPCNGVGAN